MRYLGVDWGQKKVGLSYSEGLTASPLKVLEISSLEDGVEKMKNIIRELEIEKVVVGVPGGESAKLVKKFIEKIKREVEVIESDETLSSKQALSQMINLGKGKKERKKEDAYSATLILQNFLDN